MIEANHYLEAARLYAARYLEMFDGEAEDLLVIDPEGTRYQVCVTVIIDVSYEAEEVDP